MLAQRTGTATRGMWTDHLPEEAYLYNMNEFETRPPAAKNEANHQLNRLVANNSLSIPNLTASTEQEPVNPILSTQFPAILGAIGQKMPEVDGDRVSRRVIE